MGDTGDSVTSVKSEIKKEETKQLLYTDESRPLTSDKPGEGEALGASVVVDKTDDKFAKPVDVTSSLVYSIETSIDTIKHDSHDKDDTLELLLKRADAIIAESHSEDETVKAKVSVESVLSLLQAVDSYLAINNSSMFRQYKKDRYAVARRLYDALNSYLLERKTETEQEALKGPGSTASIDSDESVTGTMPPEQAKKEIKAFKKLYDKWREKLAGDLLRTPEEIIEVKLNLFKPYENAMASYKSAFGIDKEYEFLYAEYDSLKLRKHMAGLNGSQPKNAKLEKATEVAREMDSHLLSFEEGDKSIDKGVSPKQLDAVMQIDRWLVQNFNNGGIFHKLFDQSGFVSKILTLSVRERLYVYYMVETDKRKNASLEDIDQSQDESVYVPDLSTFKDKMTATKAKVTSYFTGKYVYWHKLTEAMQHLGRNKQVLEGRYASFDEEAYEAELKSEFSREREAKKQEEDKKKDSEEPGSTASVEVEKEEEKTEEPTEKQSELKDLLSERYDGIVELQRLFIMVQRQLKKGDADREKGFGDFLLERYKVASDKVKTANSRIEAIYGVQSRTYSRNADVAGLSKTITKDVNKSIDLTSKGIAAVLAQFGESMAAAAEFFKGVGTSTGIVSQLGADIAVITSIMTLHKSIGSAGGFEAADQIAAISKGIATAGKSLGDIVGKFLGISHSSDKVLVDMTKPLPALGVAAGSLEVVYGGAVGVSALYRQSKIKSAGSFFATKQSEAREKLEANKGIPLTDEEREALYSRNMLRLSDKLREQKRDKALFALAGGTSILTSALLPGIGTLALIPAATGLSMSIGGTINEKVKLGKFDRQVFDDYFNVDRIVELILEEKQKNGEQTWRVVANNAKATAKNKDAYLTELREQVRNQLSAQFGFNSVNGATEYIAHSYAVYIHGKIFDATADHDSEEWKAYEATLKSLGMKYNPQKMRPTVAELTKKMSGR